MPLSQDTLRFIREHRRDDVRSLALQAHILYPAHLSLEQCSSQATAQYKAEIITNLLHTEQEHPAQNSTPASAGTFTDLTGGFGIDCAYLSSRFGHATYVERQETLCQIAAHNFPVLGLNHISVCHADSVCHLQEMEPVDCIFIDPARRDGHCEPDIAALEELLLRKARHVLVKLSPMLDLTLALNDLKHVRQAHIVSVGNECKELLLLLGQGEGVPADDIPIHCVNFTGVPAPQALVFTRRQEKERACPYTPQLKSYLYEPNASVLKAGAFRSLSSLYKVEKLHPNSHLYTSDHFLPDFPGRKFRITSSCGFGKKEVKEMLAAEKKANLTVRNFPATVAELRKRLKLAEGGGTYLFATTLADEKKVLIRCQATG